MGEDVERSVSASSPAPRAKLSRVSENQLLVRGVEIQEQLIDFINNLSRAGVIRSILLLQQLLGAGPQGPSSERTGLRQEPSAASTSNMTPSTIFNTRSTSPPKSACPECLRYDLDVVIAYGGVLGHDGNTALSFRPLIHHTIPDRSLSRNVPDCAASHRLAWFPVVDVGDDGNIANVFSFLGS